MLNKQKTFIKHFLERYGAYKYSNNKSKHNNMILKHLTNKDLMEMFFKFNGQMNLMAEGMYNHLENLANKREKILLTLKGTNKLPRNMQRQILHNANLKKNK